MPETLTSTPSGAAHRIGAARRWRIRVTTTIIVTAVLLLLAIGGRAITRNDTDLPPCRQLLRDVGQIYGAEGMRTTGWSIVTHDHLAIGHWAKLAVIRLN